MNQTECSVQALEAAREMAAVLAKSLPTKVEAATLTLNSKLPFKVLSLRELLIHRVSALSTAAVSLFETNNHLAGIILTRSVIETVAIAYAVEQNLNKFLRTKDMHAFDKYLMKLLIANGAPDAPHPAMDITGLVNSHNKKMSGVKEAYNALSEYVHPNWSGLLGTFGKIDAATHTLNLGMSEKSAAWGIGVNALTGAMFEFHRVYTALAPLVEQLDSYFESSSGDA